MEVADLATHVPNFGSLSHVERVKIFAWYLHTYKGKDGFTSTDIRQCYQALHLELPNISDILATLAQKKPKKPVIMLRTGNQFRLEMSVRQELQTKYGNRPIAIAVEKSLAELPLKLTDETKRKYLVEAINCYKSQCFRAAILMTWNLAYDHLVNWVMADLSRLAKFNTKLPNQSPFNTGLVVSKREDFEWMQESQVVNICGHKDIALITDNVKKMLIQGLDWRNMSAHPATIEVKQINAEHVILSLVDNVVLRLI